MRTASLLSSGDDNLTRVTYKHMKKRYNPLPLELVRFGGSTPTGPLVISLAKDQEFESLG